MRHEKVKVFRDTQTSHTLAVAPWEIPVLESVFGVEGQVQSTGECIQLGADREYPDAAAEMARLEKAYGKDGPEGPYHVVLVYGGSRIGVKALAAAINVAKQEEADARPKRAPRRKQTVHANDPLFA